MARGSKKKSPPPGPFGQNSDWNNAISLSSSSHVSSAMASIAPTPPDFGALLTLGTGSGAAEVAAEQLGHMLDGWRFLSSAYYACVTNSVSNVIHFAYYAELRAAFSMMASTGLRVRYKESYYVDKGGSVTSLSNWPTHSCVWKIWPVWLKRQDVEDTFLKAFKLHPTVSLFDLMQSLNSQLGGTTLGAWGLDLLTPLSDHDARNLSSYQSSIPVQEQSGLHPGAARIFRKAWQLMLPAGESLQFDESLAAYLLFTTMRSRISGPLDVASVLGSSEFENVVKVFENNFSLPSSFYSDVIRRNEPYFEVFDLAANPAGNPENVMIRALFLLRVSAAFVRAGVASGAPLRRRLAGWLVRVGVMDAGAKLSSVKDVYTDYEDALAELPAVFTASDVLGIRINAAGARLTRADAIVAWAV